MAWMTEQEIAEKFESDINGAVGDWFWSRSDAISELQNISDIEDDLEEISNQFWDKVQNEGEFLDKSGIFYDEDGNAPLEWMEPGVGYSMGADGEYESWDNPYKNY